jgi:hypothetical protein
MSEHNAAPQPGAGTWGEALAYPLACLGAIVGAIVGCVVAVLALHAGIYALIAVGPLTGAGAWAVSSFVTRKSDWILALMAAAIATCASIYAQWMISLPQPEDPSLLFFLTHLDRVNSFAWLNIIAGTIVAFFIAWRK